MYVCIQTHFKYLSKCCTYDYLKDVSFCNFSLQIYVCSMKSKAIACTGKCNGMQHGCVGRLFLDYGQDVISRHDGLKLICESAALAHLHRPRSAEQYKMKKCLSLYALKKYCYRCSSCFQKLPSW